MKGHEEEDRVAGMGMGKVDDVGSMDSPLACTSVTVITLMRKPMFQLNIIRHHC